MATTLLHSLIHPFNKHFQNSCSEAWWYILRRWTRPLYIWKSKINFTSRLEMGVIKQSSYSRWVLHWAGWLGITTPGSGHLSHIQISRRTATQRYGGRDQEDLGSDLKDELSLVRSTNKTKAPSTWNEGSMGKNRNRQRMEAGVRPHGLGKPVYEAGFCCKCNGTF